MNTTSISLPVSELKSALIGLGKIIAKKVTLPVLGAVLIQRDQDGWVTLTGTDLDSFATVRLEQPGEGAPAMVLIPHSELAALAKGCAPTDAITVERLSPEQAVLRYPIGNQTSEKHTVSFPTEEFPTIPQIEQEPFTIDEPVRSAIREALQCASEDETRYVLQSAYLDVSKKEGHYVVATNGRHLYSSNSFKLPLKDSLIIPDHSFLSWKPFAEDGEWRMAVQPGKQKDDKPLIVFSSRRWKFIACAVEGNYPNWRQVIPGPDEFKTSIQLSPEAVETVLKLVPKMPSHDAINGTIGIKVQGGKVMLRGRSREDTKWTDVEIEDATIRGEERTVYLNRKYFVRALQFGLSEIEIIDELSPLRFVHAGRQMIVMPIRADGASAAPMPAPKGTPQSNGGESPTTEPLNQTTNERSPMATTATSNTNGNGSTTAEKPALETALEQVESVRESLKAAVTSVTALASSLRVAQREQRSSEKEIQSARSALGKLQNVRL